MNEYHRIFFENYFLYFFYKFEGRGHNSLTVSSGEIRTSLIQKFQNWNPLNNDLNQILPKYAIEMCQIMKTGQIDVFCDLSDTWLTVPARRSSPISKEYLILVSFCFKRCGRNHQTYFKVYLGHYVAKQ